MIRVEFLIDFANFAKGDKSRFSRQRAIVMVRGGVAKFTNLRDEKWLEQSPAKTS
jgi:hypothetical protein